MPFINFNTNLSKDKVTAETMNALAQEMSGILGKDTKWINWMLSTDKLMSRVSFQIFFFLQNWMKLFYKILLFRLLITKAALIFGSKSNPLDLLMTKKSVDWWHQKYWMQWQNWLMFQRKIFIFYWKHWKDINASWMEFALDKLHI